MTKRLALSLALAGLVAVCTSCEQLLAPRWKLPAGAVELHVLPDSFPVWWQRVEACSGLTRPISEIRFFVVPDSLTFSGGRAGRFIGGPDILIIAGRRMGGPGLWIRHEMLHALGVRGHPEEYFVKRCGGVVVT